jgi:ABC-type lipoprotein release transport system permease subunit
MTPRAQIGLIARFLGRSRGHFAFAGVGLVVGSATLAFFLALSLGIRERVLNRLYPVNQAELVVETVRLFGLGIEVPSRLDEASLAALRTLPGVTGAYPKQRSRFQAVLWGGREVIGRDARVEAFFDGLDPALIREELRASEIEVMGPEHPGTACAVDGDCGSGGRCDAGACLRRTWWDGFRDPGGRLACRADSGCPPDFACRGGRCVVPCGEGCGGPSAAGVACVQGECLRTCATDASCDPGEACQGAGADRACRRLSCRLDDPRDAESDDAERLRGRVVPPPGAAAGSLPDRCPAGTYCATDTVLLATGACEAPIPVLLSPFLLEIYNRVAATALDLRRLSGLEVLVGVPFAMKYGESYFVEDDSWERRAIRRCRVVGFSQKAMDFGVTMPLGAAQRANAMLRGRDAASEFTSVVVTTARNEDLPRMISDAQVLGLVPAPRSEEARKAANMLLILTLVFALVSLVILGISAINITHTFLMLVTERRVEIAVYRAVGARLLDIRLLVLGEAAALGVLGGMVGVAVAWTLGRLVNMVAASLLGRVPGAPADLFLFTPWVVLAGMACAVLFALVGAWVPAGRAARTDPATVLSQG